MAYQFDGRIRFSEVGPDRKLTLVSLVDYFQDCSTFHSEACGNGIDCLNAHGCVWMILFWQIDILRLPLLGEHVYTKTWPYGFQAFYGFRNFAMVDDNGNYLAKANSVWALIGQSNGRPVRVLQEVIDGYELEPRLEMEYLPRKIRLPGEGRKMEPFRVGRQHLDTNHHVNNGQYIYMAEEFLPENFATGRLCVEYRQQARLHDMIVPYVYRGGDAAATENHSATGGIGERTADASCGAAERTVGVSYDAAERMADAPCGKAERTADVSCGTAAETAGASCGTLTVSLCNEAGAPYAIVKYEKA
ncbi:MAG: thioesterase [Lachnospiraceae bacterium]|nr:thioesterase [Lachnospiraceae bacterium]